MEIAATKRAYRMKEMAAAITSCQQSGTDVRSWCKENGIKKQTYYYWLRKLRETAIQTEAIGTTEETNPIVKVELPGKSTRNFIRLQYQGYILEIPPGTQASDISSILKALREIC